MNRSKQIEAAQFRYDLLSVGMNGRDWTSTKRTNFSYKIHWTRFAYQSEVMKLKINSANQRQFLPIRYGPIQFEEFYVFFSFSLLSQHSHVIHWEYVWRLDTVECMCIQLHNVLMYQHGKRWNDFTSEFQYKLIHLHISLNAHPLAADFLLLSGVAFAPVTHSPKLCVECCDNAR